MRRLLTRRPNQDKDTVAASFRRFGKLGLAAVTALTVMSLGTAAWAAWMATGSGSGLAAGSTLLSAQSPSAAASGANSVSVTWSNPAGQVPVAGYTIVRQGSSPVTVCADQAASPCNDSGLTTGTSYSYTIQTVMAGTSWHTTAVLVGSATPKATPTVSVTDNSSSISSGGNLIFTATVTGFGSTTPTGTMGWSVKPPTGTAGSCPSAAGPTGSANVATYTCTISNASVGTYSATATYPGDGNYAAVPGVTDSTATVALAQAVTAVKSGNWNDASISTSPWATNGTGTITTLTSSNTVTGSSTAFLTQLAAGNELVESDGTTVLGTVFSISSNTSLTLSAFAFHAQSSGSSYDYVGHLPDSSDTVAIPDPINVTVPTGYAAAASSLTITLSSASSGDQTELALAGATSSLNVAGNLTSSDNTSKILTVAIGAGTLTIGGNLSFTSSHAAITVGSGSINLAGSLSNGGSFTAGTGTVTFNGTSAQTIGGANPTTFNNLTIANASGVSLSGVNATVNVTLGLGSSILTTGSNTVIANGSVTRSTGFVNGNEQKPFAIGTFTPTFEVGTGSAYTPIGLTALVVTHAGTLTASSATPLSAETHYGTSGMSQTQYVNRYWTLAAGGGLVVTGYNATFTYVVGDEVGSPNTNALKVKKDISGAWTAPTSSSSVFPTVTGTTLGTTFGKYASGN
jgi:hypothetical protein